MKTAFPAIDLIWLWCSIKVLIEIDNFAHSPTKLLCPKTIKLSQVFLKNTVSLLSD